MVSFFRYIIYFILLFTFYGCSLGNDCNSEFVNLNRFLILSQEGVIIEQYDYPNQILSQNSAEEIKPFYGPHIFADSYYSIIQNYKTGEIIFSADTPDDIHLSTANNKLFLAEQKTMHLTFYDKFTLFNKAVGVHFIANTFDGYLISSDTLFKVERSIFEDDKYETVKLLEQEINNNGDRLYYVLQKNIYTLTSDSLVTTVSEDLYSNERALWVYDLNTNSHEKIILIDTPEQSYYEYHLSISKDEKYAAFTNGNKFILINLETLSSTEIDTGIHSSIFTNNENYLIYRGSSCSTYVYDISTQEKWPSFNTDDCYKRNNFAITNDNENVIYLIRDGDEIKLVRSPLTDTIYDNPEKEIEEVFDIRSHVDISKDLIHLLGVSEPVRLANGNILLYLHYQGENKLCGYD